MTYHEITFLIGRILLGGFFAFNGVNHFLQREQMAGYAGSKGVPASGLMVPLTGVMLLVGGASVLTGAYATVGIGLLALFLAVTTPVMHDFWAVDAEQKQREMTHFMKNLALLGAVLTLLMVNNWPYTVGL